MRNPDGGEKLPASGAWLRACDTRQCAQKRREGMGRWQVDSEPARTEFIVTFRILDCRRGEHLNSKKLVPFVLFQPVKSVNEPRVRRKKIFVRDHVGQFATVAQNAHDKVMLASLCTGEQAIPSFAQPPKSNPITPGQLHPRRPAFLPMQDNGAVGAAGHGSCGLGCRGKRVTGRIKTETAGAAADGTTKPPSIARRIAGRER